MHGRGQPHPAAAFCGFCCEWVCDASNAVHRHHALRPEQHTARVTTEKGWSEISFLDHVVRELVDDPHRYQGADDLHTDYGSLPILFSLFQTFSVSRDASVCFQYDKQRTIGC
jgi:hypothetical protein